MIKASPTAKISVFLEAIKAVGLYDKLTGPSFTGTVFIPNDDAFATLLSEKKLNATKTELLSEKELLTTVLLYHVSPTIVPTVKGLTVLSSLPTLLSGRTLNGAELNGKPGVKGDINFAGINATNGVQGLIGSGSVGAPSPRCAALSALWSAMPPVALAGA